MPAGGGISQTNPGARRSATKKSPTGLDEKMSAAKEGES